MSERIDLLRLHAEWNTERWNQWLSRSSVHDLESTMRAAQMGMAFHAKRKESTPELDQWFCRITRSIEKTIERRVGAVGDKEKRDEIEKHLRKASY